jgi:low temperature requirement protein LtrA
VEEGIQPDAYVSGFVDAPLPLAGSPHLRPRDGSEQLTTVVELFFDLVYVFAVTQLSHALLRDLTWAGVGRTIFLLLVVWWAWVYTTWMVNWFDPESTPVRLVLLGTMGASLLMAAAVPEAFGRHGALFVTMYVALQVGRNAGAMVLLRRDHPLRAVFERLLFWSVLSGVLWLAGSALTGDRKLILWLPALGLELLAPLVGYRTPRRGASLTTDYQIDGGHFAERCQAFIIIALGESIVVTGSTAADAGLTTPVLLAFAVAFLQTATLWWLYFGEVARHSRRRLAESVDPGRLARDAYTYLHLPIVAGIIAAAVGDDLLIAHTSEALTAAGVAMAVGGPVLYLIGDGLFRWRMIHSAARKRTLAIVALLVLAPLGVHVPATVLGALVTLVLVVLASTEFERGPRAARIGSGP